MDGPCEPLEKGLTNMDNNNGLDSLYQALREFSQQRNWDQFHSLKNLSMALSVEASELLELFQWSEGDERFENLASDKQQAIRDEVADVFLYLLRFCDQSGIDLIDAAKAKMLKNAIKYPRTE